MAEMIPTLLNSYNCYIEGGRLAGLVDAELPKFDPMTEEISGAGLAGTWEEISVGHFKSMSIKLNFRTPTKQMILLRQPVEHLIELRAAIQGAKGTQKPDTGYQVTAMGHPKGYELGKMEQSKGTGDSIEFELVYVLITYDGVEMVMADKKNFIYRVGGVDYLSEARDLI